MKLTKFVFGLFVIGFNFSTIAAEQNAIFTGAVTNATCNTKVVEFDRVTETNEILVTTVPKGVLGERVFFYLLSSALDGGECEASSADIYWSSPTFSYRGIENHTGTATDAYMGFRGSVGGHAVDFNIDIREARYSALELRSGMLHRGRLQGGNIAGSFKASATYNIVYY